MSEELAVRTNTVWSNEDLGLLPFFPMLYVAWADGDLSDVELRNIQDIAKRQTWLSDERRARLAKWLDPQHPPSATQLSDILGRIRGGAATLDPERVQSLAELGARIAEVDRDYDGEDAFKPQAREALEAIERALGPAGDEAGRRMLSGDHVEHALPEIALASFDTGALNALLEPDHRELRAQVRALATRPGFAPVYGASKEDYRERVKDMVAVLADQGWGALAFSEGVGDGDMGAFIAVFETLAEIDLSLVVKFGVQFGLFGGSVDALGTERHRPVLEQAAAFTLPGCFAMTERGHGSNVRDLETTATFDPQTDTFVIHSPNPQATKEYIGNAAAHGRIATVFAQLHVGDAEHGVHALLVPIRDDAGAPMAGVTIGDCGHKMGLNGVDNGTLSFDQVRVPRVNLLNRFGDVLEDGTYVSPIPSPGRRFFTTLGTLVGGRVNVASGGLSAAKVALALAIRYGARRRQFGPAGRPEVPILDYRAHQRRLLPLLARTYAVHFALLNLKRVYVAHFDAQRGGASEDTRELEAHAAGLKAYATWHATETIQTSRECCGGAGYTSANRFATLKADTDVFTTFEGDNTVLMQLVVKSMLTTYKQQFSDMGLFGLVRYVAERATHTIIDKNFITSRRTNLDHLRGRAFQLEVLRAREQDLLGSVAKRLKSRLDAGEDSFDAFNAVQVHLIDTAQAHIERLVLEQFAAAVESCADPALQKQLDALCDLYALSTIEADIGWFLENDYLESSKARAIRRLVEELCAQIRPQAVHLVEAFGHSEACLDVPMLKGEGEGRVEGW